MRKGLYAVLITMALLMSGCSDSNKITYEHDNTEIRFQSNVETLQSWSFQYNEGSNDYSVFFGLLNSKNEEISAEVDVDIRIVNEEGEEVYNGKKTVYEDDFGYYTSQAAGRRYLAKLRIPASDIRSGKSSNGTVYLNIHKDNTVRFDEVKCDAFYCLPVSDVEVVFDTFPLTIDVKEYDGSVSSTLQIENIEYSYEKDYTSEVKITIYGVKTYARQDSMSSYDMIKYKLYDSSGYMVTSGNIYMRSLSEGDKFRDDSTVIYDVIPGETYKFVLSEYD